MRNSETIIEYIFVGVIAILAVSLSLLTVGVICGVLFDILPHFRGVLV